MEPQQESIQALGQLDAQMAELYAQGRHKDAIPLAQRTLAIREKMLGPEHPQTAQNLNNLAELYRVTGAYAPAEPLFKRALAINEKVLPPGHPNTAANLNNLAELYRTTGAYAQAEPLFRRALAINEKVLGPEHPDTATSLNNLAELYKDIGDYMQAELLLKRALAIDEKKLGPEHRSTLLSLSNLAMLYLAMGSYSQAEPLLKWVLAIREKVLPPEHPSTAESLNHLALLYKATGAYAQAEPLFGRALAIREKVLPPEHLDTATSLNNLAELYSAMGAYAEAEPLFKRVLAIREKVLGPENAWTARSLNNLGELYRIRGAYAQAEPLLKRALAIFEKTLRPEHPSMATGLNSLALLYQAIGAYAQAESLFKRALAIREKVPGPEHQDTAGSVNDLAELYKYIGAYAQAEPLLKRALTIYEKVFGPEHPATATSLNNLAMLYLAMGAYSQTEPLLKRALAIYEKALAPEHPDTAKSLGNLGELYRTTGAYAQAEPLLKRALAINEKVFGPEHPDTATGTNNLGTLYIDMRAYAQAEPLLKRALAIREKELGPEHPETATTLGNLAWVLWGQGSWSDSAANMRRSLRIQETNAHRVLVLGDETRKRAYAATLTPYTWGAVSFSLASQGKVRTAEHTGMEVVLQRKGRVQDLMTDVFATARTRLSASDRKIFDQWLEANGQLATLSFNGPGLMSIDKYRELLESLSAKATALSTQLSERSAEFQSKVETVTVERVQQALPTDSVLIEWLRYRPSDPKANEGVRWHAPRYVAYVLKRIGEPVAIDLGAAQSIEDLVTEFRTALSDPASTYFKEAAEELSEKLIKPLRSHFAQSKRLLLSPDGALNLVPFAALVDEHGEYLAQNLELTYLTSGRDLLRMAVEPPPRGTAVVLADPNYGHPSGWGPRDDAGLEPVRSADLDRSGLVFTPLPGTAAEAKALQSLLKLDAPSVLTGDRATETNLRELHGPRILHMATHGFFLNDLHMRTAVRRAGFGPETASLPLGENPMLRSGLALAGANARHSGATDDGILTAAEAAQLDLLGTQLVVLSACETGLGTVQTGEGVYGLRRALVLAGAQTQLVSLWKVNDAAAQELMVDYYQRLLEGEGRSEALRAAQKAMLANPAHQHPCYWAAFILVGDGTPLPTLKAAVLKTQT